MALALKTIALRLLNGELPASASTDLVRARQSVCAVCPHHSKLLNQCKLCSCFTDLKTKLLEASCPVDKW